MIIQKEECRVEDVFISGASTEDELFVKIEELMTEGFDLISHHCLSYGTHIEYNAKLQRELKNIE